MDTDGGHSRLLFRLFGAFEVRVGGQTVEGLNRRKGERVLAYLVLHAGQWVEREAMAGDLWDEEYISDPESNLRQSLAFLRQRLGQDAACLEFRAGAIRLALETEQADTLRFEAACRRDDRASLAEARRLAEDPLLAGWGEAWVCRFRERLAQKLENAGQRQQARGAFLPALALPEVAPLPQPGAEAAPQGGAVPLGSSFYVVRPADLEICAALARQESIVLIKGARQVGKSSLLARGLQAVRGRGRHVCHTDMDQAGPDDLASRDAFYLRLAASLAERCGLEFVPEADWKSHLGANGNLERFLRRRLLPETDGPILWAMDGADRLFQTGYYAEFFALLRGLHTKRATEPDVPWDRLTILISAATEAHLYIRDLSQSPFNVGTRILVDDFDAAQFAELLGRFGLADWDESRQSQLRELLGGHPYLLARGLAEIRGRGMDVTAFSDLALRPDGPYRDHLEGILRFLSADLDLTADLRAALDGRPCSDAGFFRLRTAGVVSGDAPEHARPRCGLYARYFARSLR